MGMPRAIRGGNTASSGFLAIFLALQWCDRVHAYGFSLEVGLTPPPPPGAWYNRPATVVPSTLQLYPLSTAILSAHAADRHRTTPPPLFCRPQECRSAGCSRDYHYFKGIADSPWLRAHPSHSFELEGMVLKVPTPHTHTHTPPFLPPRPPMAPFPTP